MEAQEEGNWEENMVHIPEEYNYVQGVPPLSQFGSFMLFEENNDTEETQEKSRKRKLNIHEEVLAKDRRHGSVSNRSFWKEDSSSSSVQVISPWPVEWRRPADNQNTNSSRQYSDSNESERRTHAFTKKSGKSKRGEDEQSSGEAQRHDNTSDGLFWKGSNANHSQQLTPWQEEWRRTTDEQRTNSNRSYKNSSDRERCNDGCNITKHLSETGSHTATSSALTKPASLGGTHKSDADRCSQVAHTYYEDGGVYSHKIRSLNVEKEDLRPEVSNILNDIRLHWSVPMPVQSTFCDGRRHNINLLAAQDQSCPDFPKSQILHSGKSPTTTYTASYVPCTESGYTSVSNKAGCSHDISGHTVNNDAEDQYPNRVDRIDKSVSSKRHYRLEESSDTSAYENASKKSQEDGDDQGVVSNLTETSTNYGYTAECNKSSDESQTAGEIQRVDSQSPVAPSSDDCPYAESASSKESQTADYGQREAPELPQLSVTLDNLPSVLMRTSQQSGDIPEQQNITAQPSTSAAASQLHPSENAGKGIRLYDIYIKSVPNSFENILSVLGVKKTQDDDCECCRLQIDSDQASIKDNIVIDKNSPTTSHHQGEALPMADDQDRKLYSPSNEKIARIRRKRRFSYLSLQKPWKVDESSADDEMSDSFSEDSQHSSAE